MWCLLLLPLYYQLSFIYVHHELQQGDRSQPIDICSSMDMLESEEEEELSGDLGSGDVGFLVIES